MSLKSKAKARAFHAGYQDGLAWDLDGYESAEEVQLDREGWDESAFNAMGEEDFFVRLGLGRSLNSRGEFPRQLGAFRAALRSYNQGVYRGVCAPQEVRMGLPAGFEYRLGRKLSG